MKILRFFKLLETILSKMYTSDMNDELYRDLKIAIGNLRDELRRELEDNYNDLQ